MIPHSLIVCAISTLLILLNIDHTFSCLCKLLKFKCPAPPTCCESGQYALDECGCCLKCAKAELQTCGGANDITGRCGSGLQCLKTCLPCKTVGDRGKPCIFPFQYAGRTYDKCTTRDSDNGQPWCATEVDSTGYVVDNAWGDCLEGCPGTRVECDDKYFSIQEGKCIDVSVPGAIPNWFGAPAVKLLDPTIDLVTAPVCKTRGAAVRLYDNTCRCVRGETAVDFDLRGRARGNCTGLEDDHDDNLEKVWCFLENIRDPLNPKSGCYSDTKWSERDGRFWSSLACFQAPDIEGGNRPEVHPGNVNRHRSSSQRRRPKPTTRRTTRSTTTTTTRRTTTTTQVAQFSENAHTFNFTYDYDYSDYEEYNEDNDLIGPQVPTKPVTEKVDRSFEFIPGETNLPGFERKLPEIASAKVENDISDITTEYGNDIQIEEATEAVEINILDDLSDLINEIKQQNTLDDLTDIKEDTREPGVSKTITTTISSEPRIPKQDIVDVLPNLENLNTRVENKQPSTSSKSTIKPKQRSRKSAQPKKKQEALDKQTTEVRTEDFTGEENFSSYVEAPTTKTTPPKRKTKQRKQPQRNKQRKVARPTTTTLSPPSTDSVETTDRPRVGPETLLDSEYELYTDHESNVPTTTTPNFFFGFNINL